MRKTQFKVTSIYSQIIQRQFIPFVAFNIVLNQEALYPEVLYHLHTFKKSVVD